MAPSLLLEVTQRMEPQAQLGSAGSMYAANYGSGSTNDSLLEAQIWMAQASGMSAAALSAAAQAAATSPQTGAAPPPAAAGLTSTSPLPTAATGTAPGGDMHEPSGGRLAGGMPLPGAFLPGGSSPALPPSAPANAARSRNPPKPEVAAGIGPKEHVAPGLAAAESSRGGSARERGQPRHVGGVERTDAFGNTRRFFTLEEIALHNQPDDCWLVSHGKVYDVTDFLARHPAGEMAILRHGGTDSSVDFDFHSSKAQRMWAPYLLGYTDCRRGRASDCVVS